MSCDGSALAGIGEHHGLFHSPGIVAIHKPAKAIITVFAANRVSGIHWLALDKESVMFGEDKARLVFIIAKFETQIRRLREPSAIVIGALSLTYNGFVGVAIKTGYTS